jgi:hypothetical protein
MVQPGQVSGLQGNELNNGGSSNANQCTCCVPLSCPRRGLPLVPFFPHERSKGGLSLGVPRNLFLI